MEFSPAMYQCESADCMFRFPVTEERHAGLKCPLCGASATDQEHLSSSHQPQDSIKTAVSLSVLLDNIRSLYNVGSIMRIADGAGVKHLYLGGITATPAHPKLKKTALGAETAVSWSHHNNGLKTAVSLQAQGYQLWALESTPTSIPIYSALPAPTDNPILLIVGNEVAGVDPAILNRCDRIVHLPMRGHKASLNVATAFAAAAYTLLYNT